MSVIPHQIFDNWGIFFPSDVPCQKRRENNQIQERIASRCGEILSLDSSGQVTDPNKRLLLARAKVCVLSLINSNTIHGRALIRLQNLSYALLPIDLSLYSLEELTISDIQQCSFMRYLKTHFVEDDH
jgi:hypothetical protein